MKKCWRNDVVEMSLVLLFRSSLSRIRRRPKRESCQAWEDNLGRRVDLLNASSSSCLVVELAITMPVTMPVTIPVTIPVTTTFFRLQSFSSWKSRTLCLFVCLSLTTTMLLMMLLLTSRVERISWLSCSTKISTMQRHFSVSFGRKVSREYSWRKAVTMQFEETMTAKIGFKKRDFERSYRGLRRIRLWCPRNQRFWVEIAKEEYRDRKGMWSLYSSCDLLLQISMRLFIREGKEYKVKTNGVSCVGGRRRWDLEGFFDLWWQGESERKKRSRFSVLTTHETFVVMMSLSMSLSMSHAVICLFYVAYVNGIENAAEKI